MCLFVPTPFSLDQLSHSFTLCVLPHFSLLLFYLVSFYCHLVELSHSSCLTVTQGSCNVSSSFWIRHSTLLFPFELLKTYSRYYVVRNTFLDSFWIISSTKLFHSFSILLHKVSATFSFASEYIFFWVIVARSNHFVVWTATHFSRLFFTNNFRGSVPFFLCYCFTRFL